jgi:hypothetical protein
MRCCVQAFFDTDETHRDSFDYRQPKDATPNPLYGEGDAPYWHRSLIASYGHAPWKFQQPCCRAFSLHHMCVQITLTADAWPGRRQR